MNFPRPDGPSVQHKPQIDLEARGQNPGLAALAQRENVEGNPEYPFLLDPEVHGPGNGHFVYQHLDARAVEIKVRCGPVAGGVGAAMHVKFRRRARLDLPTSVNPFLAADAALQEPVLPKCTTRFRYAWDWDGRPAHLMSRAIDETGYVQPTLEQITDVRGPGTRYHYNSIRGWRVNADGSVEFQPPV